MATYDESIRSITLDAAATLAAYTGVPGLPGSASPNMGKQYRFVVVSGAHQCDIADHTDTLVIGVLQNKPQVTGAACTVAIRGVSLVQAGAAITAGEAIVVDTDGTGVPSGHAGAGSTVVGVAVGGAASGALCPVLLKI
jgi:hypothetical protein